MRSSLVKPSSGKRTLSSLDSATTRPSIEISPTSEAIVLGWTRGDAGHEDGHTGRDHENGHGQDRSHADHTGPVEQKDQTDQRVEDAGSEAAAMHHRRTSL